MVSESSSSCTVALCSLEARLLRALLLSRPKNELPDTDCGMIYSLWLEEDKGVREERKQKATTTHEGQVRPHNANTAHSARSITDRRAERFRRHCAAPPVDPNSESNRLRSGRTLLSFSA
jgi:hypothetical protein